MYFTCTKTTTMYKRLQCGNKSYSLNLSQLAGSLAIRAWDNNQKVACLNPPVIALSKAVNPHTTSPQAPMMWTLIIKAAPPPPPKTPLLIQRVDMWKTHFSCNALSCSPD